MDMTPSRIELHIEELVVSGFADAVGRGIATALERELTRLLMERGVPSRRLAGHRMPGETFHVGRRGDASEVGGDAARAVYRGLSG